jgi:diguanylate cyclase (GGDEF)-like protein
MKEMKLTQKNLFLYGGMILAALAVTASIIVSFRTETSLRQVEELIGQQVEITMSYQTGQMDNEMQKLSVAGATAAATLSDAEKVDDDAIRITLGNIKSFTGAYLLMYASTDGKAVDQSGNEIDLSTFSYVNELNKTEARFVYLDNDGINNHSAFAFFAPILNGEELKGQLILFLNPEQLARVNRTSDYANSYFYLVADEHQNILFNGGSLSDSQILDFNFFDNGSRLATTSYSWANFTRSVKSGTQTTVSVKTDRATYHVFAQPLSTAGWTLILGVPQKYVDTKIAFMQEPYRAMKIELIIIFASALILYVVVYIIAAKQSKRHNKNLEDKADTDQLTGLTNKLATERQIKEYIESKPSGRGVLVLVDVDNFKKINDPMGHAFGDEVLRQLGLRLRNLYRVSDVVGRVGGDEFMVFLKDVQDPAVMKREANKIITFFAGFEVGEYVKYSVTGSLGAAIYGQDARTFEDLYKRADEALYKSKRNGKNQLHFYDELNGQNDEEKK